jgi:hypothetical protein
MKAMVVVVVVGAACVLAAECRSGSTMSRTGTVVAPATAAQTAMLEKVKGLEGTWEMKGDDGKPATVVFHTGGGNTVREIMFPGDKQEMTNMYHLDGQSLVMTHYCAVGNQPRMRAVAGGDPNSLAFKFDSVTNKTAPDQMYMGEMTLTILDKDTIREDWLHFVNGTPGKPTSFELKRKR